jgi:hypothetical protein
MNERMHSKQHTHIQKTNKNISFFYTILLIFVLIPTGKEIEN